MTEEQRKQNYSDGNELGIYTYSVDLDIHKLKIIIGITKNSLKTALGLYINAGETFNRLIGGENVWDDAEKINRTYGYLAHAIMRENMEVIPDKIDVIYRGQSSRTKDYTTLEVGSILYTQHEWGEKWLSFSTNKEIAMQFMHNRPTSALLVFKLPKKNRPKGFDLTYANSSEAEVLLAPVQLKIVAKNEVCDARTKRVIAVFTVEMVE